MSSLHPVNPFEPDKALQIISVLGDKTRLQILASLIRNPAGMTAADISREIDKKIPSTIYQLEILLSAGIIETEMKLVTSIGREIKHWIFPPGKHSLILRVDVGVLIKATTLPMSFRQAYLAKLRESCPGKELRESDLRQFDLELLQEVTTKDFKPKAKDLQMLEHEPAFPLLLDVLVQQLRSMVWANAPGISVDNMPDMLGIDHRLADRVFETVVQFPDIEYVPQPNVLRRR